MMQFTCWKCGTVIELPPAQRVGAREPCPRCDADLHACRNCQFYDPSKNNQCAEPQADWVRDKEAANYCDYFQPNPVRYARGGPPSPSTEDARERFGSLFKS